LESAEHRRHIAADKKEAIPAAFLLWGWPLWLQLDFLHREAQTLIRNKEAGRLHP
jgi:hypothetical protein